MRSGHSNSCNSLNSTETLSITDTDSSSSSSSSSSCLTHQKSFFYGNLDHKNISRFEEIISIVENLNTRYIRQIMSTMNNPNITPDHLLVNFGITIGEFCTAYVIRNKTKRNTSKKMSF